MAEPGLARARARLWFGGTVIGLLAVVALAAPLLSPHDPLAQDLLSAQLPPFWVDGADPAYPLGTDSLGRDLLARLLYGARIALVVALLAATLAALLGTALGLAAGYLGGWIDQLVSRLVDIWMSFPPVLLSIVLVAVIGAGLPAVITAIVIVDWTRFCRVVRAEVLAQKARDYVDAALVLGVGRGAILRREILPNLLPLLAVLLGLEMGIAVTVEAILSFVGLGIASDAPSWGGLIAEGRSYVYQAWWVMALPMGCIILVVLGFNALSDGLRERFDPLLRR